MNILVIRPVVKITAWFRKNHGGQQIMKERSEYTYAMNDNYSRLIAPIMLPLVQWVQNFEYD